MRADEPRELIDGLLQRARVFEQRRDVLEQDPLLGEVRHIVDERRKLGWRVRWIAQVTAHLPSPLDLAPVAHRPNNDTLSERCGR